jgi:hypothetical protein
MLLRFLAMSASTLRSGRITHLAPNFNKDCDLRRLETVAHFSMWPTRRLWYNDC